MVQANHTYCGNAIQPIYLLQNCYHEDRIWNWAFGSYAGIHNECFLLMFIPNSEHSVHWLYLTALLWYFLLLLETLIDVAFVWFYKYQIFCHYKWRIYFQTCSEEIVCVRVCMCVCSTYFIDLTINRSIMCTASSPESWTSKLSFFKSRQPPSASGL